MTGAEMARLMEAAARLLLGEPNPHLSRNGEWRYGTHGSLSVDLARGTFFDHERGTGGGVLDLIRRELNINGAEAWRWLEENCGAEPTNGHAARKTNGEAGRRLVGRYVYEAPDGEPRFRVLRFDPKSFAQQRYEAGKWVGGKDAMRGVELVPFRLPKVIAAAEVIIVEGEKNVLALERIGFTATCNPGGTSKWRASYSKWLKDKRVAVIPDNDAGGRRHAEAVARSLHGVAARVRLLELPPDLPPKGDASDWLARGGTVEVLRALIEETPDWHQTETPQGFDATEDGLALQLGAKWHPGAKYVSGWGRWLFYDGCRWELDDRLRHMTDTRVFLRSLAGGQASGLRAAKTIAAVASLVRSNVEMAAGVDLWDRNLHVIGAGNVTVDLRSGVHLTPRAEDYITKIMAVSPAPPGTTAPLWTKFINRITAGNEELKAYLQRVAGYCLTGAVTEHVIFFLHGTGANGKSVFVNTLVELWGDYGVTIGTDMLMVSHTDRHPTEIARLRGARLAVGSEVKSGRCWAEAKIKSLSGGDRLQGRFMRQDFFEFNPQFKLMIIGNNKPSLRGVDEAIRRRLHLIPFLITIPAGERDLGLPEKLKAERPAILRWAIDGCLEWRKQGLNPPPVVLNATANYLAAEDVFELWMEECSTPDPDGWETSGDLWGSWKGWAERAGEVVGTQRRFSDKLEQHGLEPKRQAGTGARGFRGARLKRPDYTDDPRYGG